MKVVLQRVKESKVIVEGSIVGEIGQGVNLLVCIEKTDDESIVKKAANKILAFRIFNDENNKMNLNLNQVNADVLAISQFTLSWDGAKGNRPSFDLSMPPERAQTLFNSFCKLLEEQVKVEKGVFGASMEVSLINDGPVTFSLSFN